VPAIGLDHYNLRASRALLDELKDFYCTVIGLEQGIRPPFASFGYWLYAGERPVLHLSETRSQETRASHVATTFDHVAFNCADAREMEALLIGRGIAYQRARVPPHGNLQLFLHDPAGNGVELNFAPEEA